MYFVDNSEHPFNWPALVWPVLLIVFVVWFFHRYSKDMQSQQTLKRKKKKGAAPGRSGLSLEGQPGRMTRFGWLFVLALTVIFGVFSFSFSGSSGAPQTFWRATEEKPSLMLDLGEEVQLDNLIYYTGLTSQGPFGWTLELSIDGLDWRRQQFMSQMYQELFCWKIPRLEADHPVPARFIRITARETWMELGELALLTRDSRGGRVLFDATALSERYPEYSALFDEQNLIPVLPDQGNHAIFDLSNGMISSHDQGMVFDEAHHVRAAYEYIRETTPNETTHPPLGKAIIALGINIFGMSPFGWRFMGILFGLLMLPLLYVLIKSLFDNEVVAACGTILFAFENMRFTQTHVATIDAFVVFFIMAMYLFMFRYISFGYDAPLKKTLPALFMCGISFGLGVAVKWTALYAALGLLVLYVVYLFKRGRHQIAAGNKSEYRAFLAQTLAASLGFFLFVPIVIYTFSYIPVVIAAGQPLSFGGLLGEMWSNQKYMLGYHGQTVLAEEHPFASSWWMWVLGLSPMRYFFVSSNGVRTAIDAFTNPLVTIGGLGAFCVTLFDFARNRTRESLVIVVGFLALLAPWVLIPRDSFVYHYFPSVAFLVLAICFVWSGLLRRAPKGRKRVFAFTGVSVGLFFLLFPHSAGIQIPDWYSAWLVRWLPTWPF